MLLRADRTIYVYDAVDHETPSPLDCMHFWCFFSECPQQQFSFGPFCRMLCADIVLAATYEGFFEFTCLYDRRLAAECMSKEEVRIIEQMHSEGL